MRCRGTRRGTCSGLVGGVFALAALATLASCGTDTGDNRAVALGRHTLTEASLQGHESVVLDLEEGDRLAVVLSSLKKATIQHYSHDDHKWTVPSALYIAEDRECGDVEATTSGGTVAVMLECDTSYAEDQAPTRSVALVSPDLAEWTRRDLDGEAYGSPGLSPSGEYAVWSQAPPGHVLTWSSTDGFDTGKVDESGDALTLNDDGTPVTVAIPSEEAPCAVTFSAGSGDQTVRLTPTGETWACGDLGVHFPDPNTLVVGGQAAGDGFVLRRAHDDSWSVTTIAPMHVRGRVNYPQDNERTMFDQLFETTGGMVISAGSPDRRRVRVQVFDAESGTWGRATTVYDHGFPGCSWRGGGEVGARSVFAIDISCYPTRHPDGEYPPRVKGDPETVAPVDNRMVLLSVDGVTWSIHALGERSAVSSEDGGYVVVPGAPLLRASARGIDELPAADHPCDAMLVTPTGEVLRLGDEDGSHSGWPTALLRATEDGWDKVASVSLDPPALRSCGYASNEGFENHFAWSFWEENPLLGKGTGVPGMRLEVRRIGGSWQVRGSQG